MAGKLPAFQFYPGDWLKDPRLRVCSHAAKGVYIDMLCLMFESDERGVLATAGRAWSETEIAQAVGGDQNVTLAGIRELVDRGVVSRQGSNPEGAIYSRRMVRDEQKRRQCSEAGKKGGGNPALTYKGQPKGVPKGVPKRNGGSSSSVSTSTSESDVLTNVTSEDLKLNQPLLGKWQAVVAAGLLPDTREFLHLFFAVSEFALTRNNPGGAFRTAILNKDFRGIGPHEERAKQRLREAEAELQKDRDPVVLRVAQDTARRMNAG